jgi:hypothetical protein
MSPGVVLCAAIRVLFQELGFIILRGQSRKIKKGNPNNSLVIVISFTVYTISIDNRSSVFTYLRDKVMIVFRFAIALKCITQASYFKFGIGSLFDISLKRSHKFTQMDVLIFAEVSLYRSDNDVTTRTGKPFIMHHPRHH